MSDGIPFLTVIVPAFDRASVIGRCLASLAAQDFGDWEAIVVDDGSADGTAEAARAALPDPRLRVLAHARNRGVGPARNTGIDAARADWLVFLDSDDELAGPDALGRMAAIARAAPDGLHALWFRARLDDGTASPPALPGGAEDVLDYGGYLRFLDATHGVSRDMVRCVRRSCFAAVRYPEDRALEERFHLDFAHRFRSRLHPDILRLYHADAPNALTRMLASPAGRTDRALARDRARSLRFLLGAHGRALRREAPRTFRAYAKRALGLAARGRDPAAAAGTLRALLRAVAPD